MVTDGNSAIQRQIFQSPKKNVFFPRGVITVPPGRESGDTRRPYRPAGGKRRLHREVRCSKRIYPDFQGTCMGKNCAFLSRAALEIRSFSQVKPHLYIGSKKTLHISKQ